MAKPDSQVKEHKKFTGLRNNVEHDGFKLTDLADARNVDLDDELALLRRNGMEATALTGAHGSLWSNGEVCFALSGGTLIQILPNLSSRVVRSGLSADRRISYEALAGRVYYSNGAELGVIESGVSRTWGLAVPPALSAAPDSGMLPPGRYQVVMTYLRGDWQESGAGKASLVTLSAMGGIRISSLPIPTDSGVTRKRLYVTKRDSEQLYFYGSYTAGFAGPVTISNEVHGTERLMTQFLSPPPPAEYLGYHNGRMYLADGHVLRYSEPHALELFDLRKSIAFPARTRMVAPVEAGIFVATDHQIIFLLGRDPTDFIYQVKADYGVIPRTLYYGSADQIGDGKASGRAAFFASTRGLCVGLASGEMRNLTQTRYAYPVTQMGAGLVRRSRGINQYLTVLEGTETPGNSA